MKLHILYSWIFIFAIFATKKIVGQSNLYDDISKILYQLQGRTTVDQLRIFNFIRTNVDFLGRKTKQRSNNRFTSDFLPVKSSRRATGENEIVIAKSYLGRFCRVASDCKTNLGQSCTDGECRCDQHHVQINETHCLKGALLGFRCELHVQCQMRVKSSSCIQGFCRCGEGFAPYRRANCLKGSNLNEKCRTDSQCLINTEGSTCKWMVRNVLGRCQCDQKNPRRGNKCGPSGFALGAPCGRSFECSQHVRGSICVGKSDSEDANLAKDRGKKGSESKSSLLQFESINSTLTGICQCPKGYISIDNGTRCVSVSKDIGLGAISLGKECLHSSQCKLSDPYSTCRDGLCTCMEETPSCSLENRGCFNGTFQCYSNGRCISSEFVCNGVDDCSDGSDELECVPGRCSPLAFTCHDETCVSRNRLCDGKSDCPDGTDEKNCIGTKECPKSTFRCKNGQCLPGNTFCNAKLNCKDGSDEDKMSCIGGKFRVDYCPFRCKNSRCRSAAVICSGINGCGDNSDEEKCSVCSCSKPKSPKG